jgi:pimeloyl-ACP methyl ester carboxylesterase
VVTPIEIDVAVPGGRLFAVRRGSAPVLAPAAPGAAAVLLIHGITASHVAWQGVAEALPELCTIAVDLRGRGASSDLPGPYGMARHADDLIALLDAEGIERVLVAGHSMGGFVAMVLAHRYPDRVTGLVLVDGGLPLPLPEGVDPQVLLQALLGPALARLAATFPSREAYLDFWRAHPAFAGRWSPLIEAYADYDLVGTAPQLRSRVSSDAVRGDNTDLLTGSDLLEAVEQLAHPAVLLLAPRGLQDEPSPLYPQTLVDSWVQRLPMLSARVVEDVNHYTILFDPRAVEVVAAQIRAGLTQRP